LSITAFRNFFVKLFHWEYWPFGIIQIPILILWVWYGIKERSLFYFSASNPGILTGGMMGESKFEVLQLVPEDVKPKTILIKHPSTTEQVIKTIQENNLSFPLIFKPDMGERGWMVRKIKTETDIAQYLSEIKIDFIIQELVDLPLEFGVYYLRFPSQENGFVNSITMKEFLFVEGDGKKALTELIQEKDRARIQWDVLQITYRDRLQEILPNGKKLELVSIGNHCLGTTFLNGNHLITEKLSASFDSLSKQVNGFYFGRYDLRCATLQDLENGKIKIVELNGCGAEPAHIYHPGASLWKGIGDLITHWNNMYLISKENHALGVPYLSFKEGREIYKRFKSRQ
jgi:RimK-like ATP-grasp domain